MPSTRRPSGRGLNVSRVAKWFTGLACALLAYGALAAYAVTKQDIHGLILCADHGGLKVPFAKHACHLYFFSFRGTKEDIEDLHAEVGALFVTQGEDLAQRREMLHFLVSRRLDLSRASPIDGLPPLLSEMSLTESKRLQKIDNCLIFV
jgi:hypothetical protein